MITERVKKPRLPFIAVPNEALVKKPELPANGMATCPRCMRKHKVEYGMSGGRESKTLGFVTCKKGRTYLVAIDNHIL